MLLYVYISKHKILVLGCSFVNTGSRVLYHHYFWPRANKLVNNGIQWRQRRLSPCYVCWSCVNFLLWVVCYTGQCKTISVQFDWLEFKCATVGGTKTHSNGETCLFLPTVSHSACLLNFYTKLYYVLYQGCMSVNNVM